MEKGCCKSLPFEADDIEDLAKARVASDGFSPLPHAVLAHGGMEHMLTDACSDHDQDR